MLNKMGKCRKRFTSWLLLIFLLFTSLSSVWAAEPFPPKTENDIYVTDLADILNQETEQAILQLGSQLDQQTKAQVVVVTVPNLGEQDIKDYANGLFRAWGIGQKDKNNGVLLLVSRDDRKVRIEVGYGLEGALPDSKTGRILDEQVIPYFKQGDYDNGVYNGYIVLVENVAKEYQAQLSPPQNRPLPAEPQVRNQRTPSPMERAIPFILVGMFLLDFIFNRARITRTLLEMMFWLALFRGGGGGGGGGFGGGGGGFGGGSSGGGGSDRSW